MSFVIGICNEISNTTFVCICKSGWQGSHCQTKISYCEDVTCQNGGICQTSFLNYTCRCLGKAYSGQYCEITTVSTRVLQMVSKSFAYIAILVMISAAMLIIIMDVLKYFFHIDPVHREIQQKKKRIKVRPPVIIRYIYVNTPPISNFEETTV